MLVPSSSVFIFEEKKPRFLLLGWIIPKQRKTLGKKLLGKEWRWNPHQGRKSSVRGPIY